MVRSARKGRQEGMRGTDLVSVPREKRREVHYDPMKERCEVKGMAGATHEPDPSPQLLLLLRLALLSPRSSSSLSSRRHAHPSQSPQTRIQHDPHAPVIRAQVVDLLAKDGHPDVFADELDRFEWVGRCWRWRVRERGSEGGRSGCRD